MVGEGLIFVALEAGVVVAYSEAIPLVATVVDTAISLVREVTDISLLLTTNDIIVLETK